MNAEDRGFVGARRSGAVKAMNLQAMAPGNAALSPTFCSANVVNGKTGVVSFDGE